MSIRTYKNVVITSALALSAGLSVFGLEFCIIGGIVCLIRQNVLWGVVRFVLAAPIVFLAFFLFLMADYGRSKTNG